MEKERRNYGVVKTAEEKAVEVKAYVKRIIETDLPYCNGLTLRINPFGYEMSTIDIVKALKELGYEENKIHDNGMFVILTLAAARIIETK